MGDVERMKEQIVECASRGSATFIDMLARVDGMVGDGSMRIGSLEHNIWLWEGVSKDFVVALQEAIAEKRIRRIEVSPLIYFYDGMSPEAYPVAKAKRRYKSPRWLPVAFVAN